MKIDRVPGELGFRALVRDQDKVGWLLSDTYFFDTEELIMLYPQTQFKWPVEVWEDGTIYIPSEEEL